MRLVTDDGEIAAECVVTPYISFFFYVGPNGVRIGDSTVHPPQEARNYIDTQMREQGEAMDECECEKHAGLHHEILDPQEAFA